MPQLDSKAILQGRKPGRHSIGLTIGIVFSTLCLLVMLGYLLLTGLAGGGVVGVFAFGISAVAAIIPVTILVPLILLLDRLEPEPGSMLTFAFLWGAGVAVVVSFVLNTAGMELYAVPTFGADMGNYLSAAVGAPVVEESAKGLVLLLLLWRRRHEIDSYTDGVVYAAMVATGFAFTENILYFLNALFSEGFGGFAFTFILRGVIAPFGHPLYTAMTGVGVAHAAISKGSFRFLAPIMGWCAAVVLHAMWNGSSIFGWLGLGVVYVLLFFVLIAVITIAVQDRRRQVRAIGYYLPPYITTGLVTPADITMLSSIPGRRSARSWAKRNAGSVGKRAMGDYQLAATELALLHHRLDRGVAHPNWQERRDAFLALMHVAREAFIGRIPEPVAPSWAAASTDSGFLRREQFSHVIAQAQAARQQQGGYPQQGPGGPPMGQGWQQGPPPQGPGGWPQQGPPHQGW